MNISSAMPATNSTPAGEPAKRKTTLNQEDFMNLLVTQMKYQNPLEPMDNYQMANQMAQFGSLEALNNINQAVNNLSANQSSLGNLQAPGLIGKKVEAKGNSLSIQGGVVAEGSYQLSKPGNVLIQIFDANGNGVRNIQAGIKDTSKQKINWDGKNQLGAKVPDGAYTFQVSAVDEKGQTIPVNTFRVGVITGVSFENGTAYYQMGTQKITFSDIAAILA